MLPPLYAFFLYFLKILTFEKINFLNTLIFIQIILSTISVYIFFKINQKIFTKKISLINSYIFSLLPLNIYSAGQTSSITLQIFLSLLFLLFLFSLAEHQTKKKILIFSLISGLLILTRGEFILIYAITLLYLLIKNKIKVISIITIALCTLLVISPYLIRNYNSFNQIFISLLNGHSSYHTNNWLVIFNTQFFTFIKRTN